MSVAEVFWGRHGVRHRGQRVAARAWCVVESGRGHRWVVECGERPAARGALFSVSWLYVFRFRGRVGSGRTPPRRPTPPPVGTSEELGSKPAPERAAPRTTCDHGPHAAQAAAPRRRRPHSGPAPIMHASNAYTASLPRAWALGGDRVHDQRRDRSSVHRPSSSMTTGSDRSATVHPDAIRDLPSRSALWDVTCLAAWLSRWSRSGWPRA